MELIHVGGSRKRLPHYPAHTHQSWELIYNWEGDGTMTVDGRTLPFKAGTILLCPPCMPHEKTAETGFSDLYVLFSHHDLNPRYYLLEDDQDRRIYHLLRILYTTYYEANTKEVCDQLFAALMGILRPALDGGSSNRYVQMLRSRIVENFTDPDFRLQTVQQTIPANPDHLRRLFKKELGQTPHDYLMALRLEYARQLLSREQVSVAEAAYRSGFYDPLYFSRCFRKCNGESPSQFQAKHLLLG